MKKLYSLFIIGMTMCVFSAKAQSLHYVWALGATGAVNNDEASSIKTDASGNVYIMGSYASPLITFGTTVLTNVGLATPDMFLLKLNASGAIQWAKSAGGGAEDKAESIAIDASGNVYAAGTFKSNTMLFGATMLSNTSVTGTDDMFLVKYDAAGNVVWAKNATGTGNEHAYAITTDASGNVYVAGDFSGATATFGSTTLTNIGGSGSDMFLVKYDASGSVVWAYNFGGNSDDRAMSLHSDMAGNIYAAGSFNSSTINFGATTLTNMGAGSDMFVVKFDATGSATWAYSTGGNSSDEATSIMTDASGSIYLAGNYKSSTIAFSTTTLTNASAGSSDMFLVKFSSSGSVQWAKSTGGSGSDVVASLAADAAGRLYIAGRFASNTIMFGSTTLTKGGDSAMFVAEFAASSGAAVWANSTGGSGTSEATSISADASGEVYTAGSYSDGSMTFGSMMLSNASTGSDDMYAARMNRTTGIYTPLATGKDMFIYPVPNNGDMTIVLNGKGYTQLSMYDVTGRNVYTQSLNENDLDRQLHIQVANPADGVCILQAHSREGVISKRIMIFKQ